jgi:hypothetical protein
MYSVISPLHHALGALRQINRKGFLAPKKKNACRRRLQAVPPALDLSPLEFA